MLLPEDRDYSFSGNLDPVEEIEVELSRAEAYASDIQRLRKVALEGNYAQQTVAVDSVLKNTGDLRRTLEVAQSRIAELEEAAKDGRVDAARVAESRRKAESLEKEIADALRDVKDKAVQRGETASRRGAAGATPANDPMFGLPQDARAPQEPDSRQEEAPALAGIAGHRWAPAGR